MAKKQEKEVERWITVNGARVPIFKDGSIGGPKELRDKLKASKDKKSSNITKDLINNAKNGDKIQVEEFSSITGKPTGNTIEYTYANGSWSSVGHGAFDNDSKGFNSINSIKGIIPKIQKVDGKKQETTKSSFGKEFQDKADKYREKFLTKRSDAEIAELKKNLDKSTSLTGTSQNDHVAYKAIEDEMKRREQSKSTTTSNIIKANDDLKEKQIVRNKAEKDAINGKKANKSSEVKAETTISPRAEANSMNEAQLRAYVKKNNLTKSYNMMMNTRPGAYGYSKQLQVLRDLVADDMARRNKTQSRKTLISKSISTLKSMYANASTEEEKRMIAAELGVRGYYRKQGKWSSSGGGR